jgi:hypothetical protein
MHDTGDFCTKDTKQEVLYRFFNIYMNYESHLRIVEGLAKPASVVNFMVRKIVILAPSPLYLTADVFP